MAFWAGMAAELAKMSQPWMTAFVRMAVSGYFRPSELLSLRRCDLLPPAPGVTQFCTVLLFPEERRRPSKTMQYNHSIEMDDPRVLWLEPMWLDMARPGCTDRAWAFRYPDLCPDFCPYQMRPSGPSTDLADRRRAAAEAQKRSRRAQPHSMLRYQPSARLAAEWAKVPAATRAHCQACVARLADIVLGPRRLPVAGATPPLPAATWPTSSVAQGALRRHVERRACGPRSGTSRTGPPAT